jgi:hypothetical protein
MRQTFSASKERTLASLEGWPHTQILHDVAKRPLLIETRYAR